MERGASRAGGPTPGRASSDGNWSRREREVTVRQAPGTGDGTAGNRKRKQRRRAPRPKGGSPSREPHNPEGRSTGTDVDVEGRLARPEPRPGRNAVSAYPDRIAAARHQGTPPARESGPTRPRPGTGAKRGRGAAICARGSQAARPIIPTAIRNSAPFKGRREAGAASGLPGASGADRAGNVTRVGAASAAMLCEAVRISSSKSRESLTQRPRRSQRTHRPD
jgi:hypothetical protein